MLAFANTIHGYIIIFHNNFKGLIIGLNLYVIPYSNSNGKGFFKNIFPVVNSGMHSTTKSTISLSQKNLMGKHFRQDIQNHLTYISKSKNHDDQFFFY